MVEPQPSKLMVRVRFPSLALLIGVRTLWSGPQTHIVKDGNRTREGWPASKIPLKHTLTRANAVKTRALRDGFVTLSRGLGYAEVRKR